MNNNADRDAAQCETYYHHLTFAATFNISADVTLLAVPLRLLPKLQIPLNCKLVIIAVLGLGVFNVRRIKSSLLAACKTLTPMLRYRSLPQS